jgi:tetratricopeptide (TPR) repeat protein
MERMGNTKLAHDTYSQAVASANRSIDLFLAGTVPAAALLRRGMMRRKLGQSAEAMADFTALVDADKGNSEARYERARTLLDLGRLNDALGDIDAAVCGSGRIPVTSTSSALNSLTASVDAMKPPQPPSRPRNMPWP